MNIYQRINAIRAKVSYVQKDKTVAGHGYKAVTHDAITAASRQAFIEHGVVCVPSLKSSEYRDTGTTTAKGTPFIRYQAIYEFVFINVDQPEDRFPVVIESHALDEGDKAPGKALSYAKKNAVLKLLEIETGEDDEGRVSDERGPPAPARITPEQVTQIRDLLTDAGIEDVKFCATGGIAKVDDLAPENFESAKKWIAANKAKRAKSKAAS